MLGAANGGFLWVWDRDGQNIERLLIQTDHYSRWRSMLEVIYLPLVSSGLQGACTDLEVRAGRGVVIDKRIGSNWSDGPWHVHVPILCVHRDDVRDLRSLGLGAGSNSELSRSPIPPGYGAGTPHQNEYAPAPPAAVSSAVQFAASQTRTHTSALQTAFSPNGGRTN